MQKVHREKWDMFKKELFETLDAQTTEDFEMHVDALHKKVAERVYSLDEVRGLLTYRSGNGEGYTIGHKICRRRFVDLAIRMRGQHEQLWGQ